jgi:hypothetical protein
LREHLWLRTLGIERKPRSDAFDFLIKDNKMSRFRIEHASCFMVFIMIFTPLSLFSLPRILRFLIRLRLKAQGVALSWIFFLFLLGAGISTARAYVTEGASWASGTTVTFQLGLGNAGRTLTDGNTSWNTAASPILDMWDQKIQRVSLTGVVNPSAPVSSGDGVNSIVFSSTVFGQSFGSSTLAVTYYRYSSSRMSEADILFNTAQSWDSYRGAVRYGAGGRGIGEIRRVLLHEMGHALGLGHPDQGGQSVDAVMNSIMGNRETLSNDDVAGGQSLYGAPTPPPTPTPTATPTPTPASHVANISTRMNVGLNDDVLIGGFIVRGSQSKKVIVRALGPSLSGAGVTGAMANPTLELHDSTGATIATDDDWQTGGQSTQISASGLAPSNSLESAIIATLAPGSYTAIVRGVNSTTGIALVEGYELDSTTTRLVNVSTRGHVGVNDDVLIGGFIIRGSQSKKVVVRALGPSLSGAGVAGAMANPTLELHDSTGATIATDDNWQTGGQSAQISASGFAPSNSLESAIIATLAPGSYTAIVKGVNGGTGVGMVELYDLDP